MIRLQTLSCETGPKALTAKSWDWLITGKISGARGDVNLRNCFIPRHLCETPRVQFYNTREKQGRVVRVDYHLKQSESHHIMTRGWSAIGANIEQIIGPRSKRVLVDLTTLSLECLLYLFPALFRLNPQHLACTYISPEKYPDTDDNRLYADTATIEQPKGYTVFQSTRYSQQHIILPGFDKGRVFKYIRYYDWPWERIVAVIGDPAYAENGEKKVATANKIWLRCLARRHEKNIKKVPAHDPFAMHALLNRLFQKNPAMDIIPLGPTPLILGVLLFYFSLTRDQQETVRFLCDFPKSRQWQTQGLGNCYVYSLNGLVA